jgi:transposase
MITESIPDHSTLSLIRNRLPESVYSQMYSIILSALKDAGLVKGKNIAFDSSIIEANASLSKLQNRMTKETYEEYVKELAAQSGVDTSDKAAVARFDRKRPDRKTSNEVWVNPHDPDAKIGKTKHGSTDMVYKPEHVVDLDTGAIIDINMLPGDHADSSELSERIINAQIRLNDIADDPTTVLPIQTVTSDKGYFKATEIQAIQDIEVMTVIPDFIDNRNFDKLTLEETIPLCFAKAEVKSKEGKSLLKRRGMHVERSFAHVLDSGGQRRTTLRKNENILKRHRIAVASYNLSLLMRKLFGIGTPKQFLAYSISSFSWGLGCIWCINIRLLANFRLLLFLLFRNTLLPEIFSFDASGHFCSKSTGS